MELDPTALVVDDDGFMRDLLERLFADAGIPVQTFESAEALLAQPTFVRAACCSWMSTCRACRVLRCTPSCANEASRCRSSFSPPSPTWPWRSRPCATVLPTSWRAISRRSAGRASASVLRGAQPHGHRCDSKRIARTLGGSFRTIETHRGRVMTKMVASSLVDLVRMNLDARTAPTAPQQPPS